MLDPRSPSARRSPTLALKLQEQHRALNQSLVDPRSPSLSIPRTPVPQHKQTETADRLPMTPNVAQQQHDYAPATPMDKPIPFNPHSSSTAEDCATELPKPSVTSALLPNMFDTPTKNSDLSTNGNGTPTKESTPQRRPIQRIGGMKSRDIFLSSPTLSNYSPKNKHTTILNDLKPMSPKRASINDLVLQTSKMTVSSSPSRSSTPALSPARSRVASTKYTGFSDSLASVVDENNPNSLNSSSSTTLLRTSGQITKPTTPKTPRVRGGPGNASPSVTRRGVELRGVSTKFDGSPMKLNMDAIIHSPVNNH
ncbi:hypothetical protein SAMD00019534_096690 [Acytostelium subglobosum LB1]|uniref:hypothetical protein n=1 Tax=Acytostelium subglobosum LB1 TaxID=1410327 RepID=UPI000644A590|nr:hypothetical protein SAMD00019534_096690 [Acytostelium subglobosum LB1]GAM26494.1 hypothetical protein SAMD00019534_096690 [Acytostelium subglobosum LB1]|eukprot:XP_012750590.1 hypothetical protein SAMD00019534_096690 [Acytostelium subglobosum LB1]